MHHSSFKVIFDVTESGYRQWEFVEDGLLFVGIGIALIIFRRFYPDKTTFLRRLFPYFLAGFSLVWTLLIFAGTYSDYSNLRNAMLNGRFQIVEGTITDFVPMTTDDKREHFLVNGHYYQYSDAEMSAGFNNTQAHGGPLHEGVYLRIWEVDGKIARLEIKE